MLLSLTPYLRLQAVELITAALATARAEEREACAVEAEKFATLLEQAGPITVGMRTYDRMTWAKDIAAALRARGEG